MLVAYSYGWFYSQIVVTVVDRSNNPVTLFTIGNYPTFVFRTFFISQQCFLPLEFLPGCVIFTSWGDIDVVVYQFFDACTLRSDVVAFTSFRIQIEDTSRVAGNLIPKSVGKQSAAISAGTL